MNSEKKIKNLEQLIRKCEEDYAKFCLSVEYGKNAYNNGKKVYCGYMLESLNLILDNKNSKKLILVNFFENQLTSIEGLISTISIYLKNSITNDLYLKGQLHELQAFKYFLKYALELIKNEWWKKISIRFY